MRESVTSVAGGRMRGPRVLANRRAGGRAVIAGLLAITASIGILAVAAGAEQTRSAWTDRVVVASPVTAGTWANCTAEGQDGSSWPCTITRIEHDSWGTPGDRTRGYTITFSAPPSGQNAKWITFTADLSTSVPRNGAADGFSWAGARIVQNDHIDPAAGWTCADLPLLTARTREWQTQAIYLQVREGEQSPSCQ